MSRKSLIIIRVNYLWNQEISSSLNRWCRKSTLGQAWVRHLKRSRDHLIKGRQLSPERSAHLPSSSKSTLWPRAWTSRASGRRLLPKSKNFIKISELKTVSRRLTGSPQAPNKKFQQNLILTKKRRLSEISTRRTTMRWVRTRLSSSPMLTRAPSTRPPMAKIASN